MQQLRFELLEQHMQAILLDAATRRGALQGARKVHQNYYLPMTTAMAVALFE